VLYPTELRALLAAMAIPGGYTPCRPVDPKGAGAGDRGLRGPDAPAPPAGDPGPRYWPNRLPIGMA